MPTWLPTRMLAASSSSLLAGRRTFALPVNARPATPYRTHQPTAGVASSPLIHSFYHEPTSTFQFVVVDPVTKDALVVDPALDYDPASGHITTETASGLIAFVAQQAYSISRVLETHVHADHLSASRVWQKVAGSACPISIGRRVTQVQDQFGPIYDITSSAFEGSFDALLEDDEVFRVGELQCKVLHLPGHTPDHIGVVIGDSVFAGDSIFLPDVGSARADFAGGSAQDLFKSAQTLLSLPDSYRIFSGHDYPGKDRSKSCFSSVADQRAQNKHVNSRIVADEFARMREERDATLGTPRLMHASLQVNLRGGRLPEADGNGRRWLRMPISIEQGLVDGL